MEEEQKARSVQKSSNSTSMNDPAKMMKSDIGTTEQSSFSVKPFPTSPISSPKDADAFDAIVQAANPSHPQHAAWVERYSGSIRSTRKSMEGSPSSNYSSGNVLSSQNSVRKTRSKSGSRNGKSLSNPSKVRPALDERMMPRDPTKGHFMTDQIGQIEHTRALSGPVSPTNASMQLNEGRSSQFNDNVEREETHIPNLENNTDATIGGSSSKAVSERSHRRRKKKDKGKGKASAPPVPPPRTTSHAAFVEASNDNSLLTPERPSDAFEQPRAVRETHHNDISTSMPTQLASQYSHNKTNGKDQDVITFAPAQQQSTTLHGPRMRSEERTEGIVSSSSKQSNLSLHSPVLSSTFPQRQSSVSPDLGSESQNSIPSSPRIRMTSFANMAQSLSGRRSIDFRLPDDEMNKIRQDSSSRSSQRRGLDAIFSPLRSAVAARRAERQSMSPQLESIKPQPILRPPSSLNIHNEQAKRFPPTPPPRSPLRRSPMSNNTEAKVSLEEGIEAQKKGSPLACLTDLGITEEAESSSQKDGRVGKTRLKETSVPEKVIYSTPVQPIDQDSIKNKKRSSNIIQYHEDSPPLSATMDDPISQSNPTFISFVPNLSHRRSVSADTEDGQEFHDAMSDEGGNGSSADEKPSKTTVKKRRSRRKSIESSQAARQQVKESALVEPMPKMVEIDGSILQENPTRRRCDSSASEDLIPLAIRKNSLKNKASKRQLKESYEMNHPASNQVPQVPSLDTALISQSIDENKNLVKELKNEEGQRFDEVDALRLVTPTHDEEYTKGLVGHMKTESDTSLIPKDLPRIPISSTMSESHLNENYGIPVSYNSRTLIESQRLANGVPLSHRTDLDVKQLPTPPSLPLPPLPRSPSPEEILRKQITHKRSFSRSNQNGNSSSGKISGVFSKMRRDKTPSYANLPRSESRNTSMTGSTSQFHIVSPRESPVQNDQGSGIGLGIETTSLQSSSKGTSTSDQHYQHINATSPQVIRSPSSESGWRTRLPSFSASRSAKMEKAEKQRLEMIPPPLPLSRESQESELQRQKLLYEVVGNSVNGNLAVQETILPSPTIHKTLSPALLREEKHEADEVASFIGSDDAQEERLADSRRGTWNSFSNFELAPNKVYEENEESVPRPPIIDIQPPQQRQNDSSTKSSNLTSDSISLPMTPMTPSLAESNSHLKPSNSISPEGVHLSMTARRLSNSSSNPKTMVAPQALDLSAGKLNTSQRREVSDGSHLDAYDDSRTSPFLRNSPIIRSASGEENYGSLAFPTSPGNASINSNGGIESKRNRNMSIGSTILNGVGIGNGTNTSKPRSSFATDRDRSPVVNQIWADLPPSPSPKVTTNNMRKFFTSSGKNPLRLAKLRTSSTNALMSPNRPNFTNNSPFDGSFPVSPAIPSGQSELFAEHWKNESVNGNGNKSITSNSNNNLTGYPLAQSASTSSSLRQATFSSHDHSPSHTTGGSPIAYYRQMGTPRGMPGSAIHSSTSINTGFDNDVQKEYIGEPNEQISSSTTAIPQEESFYSLPSSRSITSQRMIDSSGMNNSIKSPNSTTDIELEAFGKMLRESAREDAQRVRQIAKRSVSANNTPQI